MTALTAMSACYALAVAGPPPQRAAGAIRVAARPAPGCGPGGSGTVTGAVIPDAQPLTLELRNPAGCGTVRRAVRRRRRSPGAVTAMLSAAFPARRRKLGRCPHRHRHDRPVLPTGRR